MPVVQMQHVNWAGVGTECLERGSAEQPEPPGVVGKIPGRVAVEPLAIEGRGMIHQAQPIAVGPNVDDRDRAMARRRARIRHVHQGGALDGVRNRDIAVARQEDVDRRLQFLTAEAPQGTRQRVDDVGQAAGLGPRFAFGRQNRDPHRHAGHRTGRL